VATVTKAPAAATGGKPASAAKTPMNAKDDNLTNNMGMNRTRMKVADLPAATQYHSKKSVNQDWGKEYGPVAQQYINDFKNKQLATTAAPTTVAPTTVAAAVAATTTTTASITVAPQSGTNPPEAVGSPGPALVAGLIVVLALVVIALCLGSQL